jgi:PAS domain S-box-containing protein
MIVDRVQGTRLKKEPYKRLAEINRAITNSLDFDHLLHLIVDNAAQLFEADSSVLLLADPDQALRIRASIGIDPVVASTFYGRMEEDVIRTLHRTLGLTNDDNIASVPIIAKNELNGLLVIVRETPLAGDETWQMSALADQAAIALRNARLYEMELMEANRERDETLEALQASNRRVTRILESITDLYYQLDNEWRFTDVNRQAELRFGQPRNELLGKVLWEVFPQLVDTFLQENFFKAVEDMTPVHFELPSLIASGTFFEVHAYPTGSGLTVYLRDISERKRGEVTSHLLASIVESSDDAIISKDLNGIISSWNKGAEQIFGYTASEVIGKSITILIPEERLDEEPAILRQIRSGRAIEHYETVRRRKDGELIDISVSVSPIKDDSGNIVGASKIARDITAHRRAHEEIRFQARLLNAVGQGIIATDLKGQIIYWNDFAETLYGWTAAEAIGSNVMDLIPAVDSKRLAEEIFTTLREGKSWSGEMIVKRRDGFEFPAMVTDSPITNAANELIGIVGVSIDISREKRAEEERRKLHEREKAARVEAEKANRLKDEFLATLSHELRNPLNVVIGYSEILRRTDSNKNSGFVTRAAEVIRRNALAQSQLVSDLLDLSRLQMGKLAINRQPVALSTIISDAIETVRAETQVKKVSLVLDLTKEDLVVNGDAIRLGQIAWNLLNNAVKFTPSGGTITISLSEEDDKARFTVADTGQGISSEFLPHVFEIFRQADGSSSRRQGGMGIGLALVKQLAELHGGYVKAESEGVGKGARVSVWIPVHVCEIAKRPSQSPAQTRTLANKTILVIDDSPETTEMLSKLLQLEGAQVKSAASGTEALEVASGNNFDLIISDISMPEMDGYELLAELRRQIPRMAEVPALALTGYGRDSDVARARREGFAEHLTKPLDIEKLLQTVKHLTCQK